MVQEVRHIRTVDGQCWRGAEFI